MLLAPRAISEFISIERAPIVKVATLKLLNTARVRYLT